MVTVVFAVRDRSREIVSRSLNSLRFQKCKIIVVDYGSKDLSWYREVIGNYIAAGQLDPDFNKAKALNIGFKLATTEYVISSDIDNIFEPNFIDVVESEITKPKTLVLCERHDIMEDGRIKPHAKTAYGACFGIDREWIYKVRGYDERFVNWGKEDDDLYRRALSDGYTPVWISDGGRTKIMHQYHEPSSRKSLRANASLLVHSSNQLVRNPHGWGELV